MIAPLRRKLLLLALLSASAGADVIVTGKPPTIDTALAGCNMKFDAQAFERLPGAKNPAELLLLVPPPPSGFTYNHVSLDGGAAHP